MGTKSSQAPSVERFSPGPWHPGCLGSGSSCKCTHVLDEGHAGGIATVSVNNGIASITEGGNDAPPEAEAIANMYLIAAAPDMHAALDRVEALLSIVLPRSHTKEYLETLDQVRAALAKASPLTVRPSDRTANNTDAITEKTAAPPDIGSTPGETSDG